MTDDPTVPPDGEAADDFDPQDALRDAVARARRAAREKGLRPGHRPLRRKRAPGAPARPDDGRDPSVLGDQLERLLLERGWKVDVAAGAVLARWGEIVGPTVAGHTTAEAFEDGVLTVRTSSTAWRTQLSTMTSTLLRRIEEEIGPDVVQELRFVGPSAPSWSRGPRKVHGGRGPRDTYG